MGDGGLGSGHGHMPEYGMGEWWAGIQTQMHSWDGEMMGWDPSS